MSKYTSFIDFGTFICYSFNNEGVEGYVYFFG